MTEIVFLIEDAPEGGYTARALGESIFTEADDIAQLREAIRDAVRCHFPTFNLNIKEEFLDPFSIEEKK